MAIVLHAGSGAKDYQVLDAIHDDDQNDALILRARTMLNARAQRAAADILLIAPFRAYRATNDFGDEFDLLMATLPVEAYERLRKREAELTQPGWQLATALADLGTLVRMIVVQVESGTATWSPEGYRAEADPIGEGGYARVYRALDSKTGLEVALKRPLSISDEEALARLRREIQEQSRITHRNVMPILKHGEDFSWFVMPLADGSLAEFRHVMDDEEIVAMVDQVAQGLEAAHALDRIHRDVTPRNILRLTDSGGTRWVVADWGMVRRPRGLTSTVRTRPGEPFGTEGFVAPELLINAHDATACSDVYSLGRVLGFALTGHVPIINTAQDVPKKWRLVVRQLTERSPARRVQTMREARRLLARVSSAPVQSTSQIAAALVDRIDDGDVDAAGQLLDLALASPDDDEIWLDQVVRFPKDAIEALTIARADDVDQALERLEHHVRHTWGNRQFDDLNEPLRWILNAAEVARAAANDELLESACRMLFNLDPHWGMSRSLLN